MKKLYMIGGTMGVGKTTTCLSLLKKLDRAVFLDGDWCWYMDPFLVNDETKAIVTDNIVHLLNNFIKCSAYENIVFCWVMHEQGIIDDLLNRLNGCEETGCGVHVFSLVCGEHELRERLEKDVLCGKRSEDVIGRSVNRIHLYDSLNTVKIDVSRISPDAAADLIAEIANA